MFSESKETSHSSLCLPYTSSKSQNVQYDLIGASVTPTDAGFVAWAMMFSCVVTHPCTMLRKSKILAVGGCRRTAAITCTEDYHSWLRVIKEDAKCICSLPIIGIFHRKHNTRSPNDERKIRQRFIRIRRIESPIHFGALWRIHSLESTAFCGNIEKKTMKQMPKHWMAHLSS